VEEVSWERVKRYHETRREAGLVQIRVWIPDTESARETIKTCAKLLIEERDRTGETPAPPGAP